VSEIQVAQSHDVALEPAPIPPAHVLSGTPTARNAVVFKSDDKLQITLLWHCTAGSFRWFYDEDETILLLEGGMTLHFDDGTTRTCAAGDTVFFPVGTSCVWVIETEVRKLAFFRKPAPQVVALPLRVLHRLLGASVLQTLRRRRYLSAIRAMRVGQGALSVVLWSAWAEFVDVLPLGGFVGV
jgi:uncharacterized protein